MNDLASLLAQYNVLGAFWLTIQLTLYGALGALVIDTIVAVCRVSPVGVLQRFGTGYVTVLRNTPLTLIVALCSLGLSNTLRITLAATDSSTFIVDNGFRWGVVALAVYHATFVAESLRSGINTVPVGQAEAARAIGLGFWAAARLVILPQAFRGAVAPLGNVLIALTKNSTVAAAGSVAEASGLMRTMIEFRPDVILAIFLTFAFGFVVLVVPVGLATTSLSRRLAVAR